MTAYSQLVTATAAAAHKACELSQERVALLRAAERQDMAGKAVTVLAWRLLRNTCEGQVLVDSLLEFGSLLCAALPNRFCCNEPSCCCFDTPAEVQLAVQKGSKCSGCGAARYCGAADQHKHWSSTCQSTGLRLLPEQQLLALSSQNRSTCRNRGRQRVLPDGCEMGNHV